MSHRERITNFIWMQESDYWDSPVGKLEKTSLVRTMLVPLQQGFHSDSKTAFPVAVHDLATFAFEQRIVGTMPFPNSTAMGTPFACVPTIHNAQMNIIIKAPLFNNLPEFKEWNTHDGSIEVFAFGAESIEFFNSNIGIILDSETDDFSDHLTEVCLDEVPFTVPCLDQFLSGIVGLENSFAFHELLSFYPDMLSEIGLVNNSTIRGNYADSEMFGIDINSQNILSMGNLLFFGEISDNLQAFGQTICLANPSATKQVLKSLVIPVLLDRNSDAFSGVETQLDKKIGFCIECPAISGNIELDGHSIDITGSLFPSVPYQGTANLNIKRGVFLAN